MQLQWYYRVGDFEDVNINKSTSSFIKTMAPDELLFSDHFTINPAESIFGHSRMVRFNYDKVDLRPIGHNDTFACGALMRLRDARFVMQVPLRLTIIVILPYR